MAPVTNAGDVISIPAHTADSESATITFTWSQSLRSRTETYYILKGKNVTQGGGDTLIFIQKDWYAPGGAAENVSHFTKKDSTYEFTVDNRFQYGQKNAAGESRFLVYHDKGRKPYQHRFVVTTIQGNAAKWAGTFATSLGYGAMADAATRLGNSFVGDYLHNF